MSFTININKEIVNILLQENKRLKRDNQQLRESLNELQRYKDEYKGLIERLHDVKESYIEKMNEFEKIEKAYRKELEKLTKK